MQGWRATAVAMAIALTTIFGGTTAQAVEPRTWESRYDWTAGHGYAGWHHATHAADQDAYGFAAGFPDAPGLWLWPAGGREHRPGGAEWSLAAPGTTRLIGASLNVGYAPKLFAHHCLRAGLRTAGETRHEIEHCKPPNGQAEDHRVRLELAAADSGEAYLGVRMPVCNNPDDRPCSKHLPEHDPQTTGPFARSTSIDLLLVDDDLPVVATTSAVRDQYVDGTQSHPVELAASDAGSGVRRMLLRREGGPAAQEADARCDWTHRTPELGARICPEAAGHTFEIDARPLAEGAHTFRGAVEDLSGQEAAEPAWRVMIDRTPPAAPAEFELDLDEEADTALVTWVAGDDPVLADGTAGSGTGESEHRFWHPRLGWSEWHRGEQTVEIPDSLQGDTIKIEARNADRVGNWSALAAATLDVPVGDEEDDFEEYTDDDLPDEDGAPVATPASTRTFKAASSRSDEDESSTLAIRAVTASDRRRAALEEVRAACVRERPKGGCYGAVEAACRVGGICTRAKEIACLQVRLYCPKASASRVSLFERFQPNFRMATYDRFYPVSFNTALNLRWDGRVTNLVYDGRVLASGARAIRPRLGPMSGTDGNLYLDYPAGRGDLDEQFESQLDALGIDRLDLRAENSHPQWNRVYDSSRIYWYRGGGFGANPGPRGTVKTLQYWTFHTYNYLDAEDGPVYGKHEGDAEVAAVAMNRDNEPKYFFMSRHGMNLAAEIPDRDEGSTPHREAIRMHWDDSRLEKFGDRVNVYPGTGSHAMYNDCGTWRRGGGAPDDHVECATDRLLNFNWQRTRRIPLGRAPWACWGGRLGTAGGHGVFESAGPHAPLWQQGTFRGDANPCRDASASAAAPVAVAARTRAASVSEQSGESPGGDPLLEEFSRCESWYQSPGQPGAEVVACDQAQLDHYFASGLTDPGPGGARLDGPGGATNDVPAVYHSRDPADLAKVTATGTGHATGIYASRFDADGTVREAVFEPVAIPDGERVRVRWGRDEAHLVGAGGRVVARTPVMVEKTAPRRIVKRPRGVRVRVRGARAVITFRPQPGVRMAVSAGRTRSLAGGRYLATSRRAARRVVVRLGRRDRWLQIYGFTRDGRGDAVTVRVRRR